MQKKFETIPSGTDDELVNLAREGVEDAFAELMMRHHSSSLKVAYSILRNPMESEDEVQNAYWSAYQHIGQFHQEAKFSTWLTRIVVNQCLMRLRRQRRVSLLHMDDVPIGEDRGTLELVAREKTPEEEVAMAEQRQLLDREIGRIPPLLRGVLVLRDVDGLPMPEVAERLGISIAAAKSRLLRARQELRARLEKYCGRMGPATLTAAPAAAIIEGVLALSSNG